MRLTLCSGALLAVLGCLPLAANSVSFTITNLGVLPGSDFSEALAVNNAGQVAGRLSRANSDRAFLWDGTQMIDLGLGMATGINDQAQVVGMSRASGVNQAFLYSAGVRTDLPLVGGTTGNEATDINNAGVVTGLVAGFPPRAVTWSNGQGSLLEPNNTGEARAVNEAGTVVGSSFLDAAVFSNGSINLLAGLPGSFRSQANAISESGLIAGYSNVNSASRAVLWDGANAPLDLGFLPGANFAVANGVNSAGWVVGFQVTTMGRAFLYRNGQLLDLNSFLPANSGWVLSEAFAVSEAGHIVGYGQFNGLGKRAFLLTPDQLLTVVPEPSTYAALTGLGLAAFAWARRRRVSR